jgi:ankyrin repeat protein
MASDVERAFEAVQSGDADALAALLAADRSLARSRSASGISLLLTACYHRRTNLVEMLRSADPTLDIFEASAVSGGAEQGAELLDADPGLAQAFSADGFTALHLAAYFGQEAMAAILLERGADADAVSRNAMSLRALHSASVSRELGIVALLLDRGANVNAKQHGGWTPLHAAAFNSDMVTAKQLVARGADPGLASDDGKTPLDVAVEKGHETVAGWLRALREGTRRE